MTDEPITPEAVEHFTATAMECRAMTDDITPKSVAKFVDAAKWSKENATGMTLESDEIDVILHICTRAAAAESKLAMAVRRLTDMRDDTTAYRHTSHFRRGAAVCLAEIEAQT